MRPESGLLQIGRKLEKWQWHYNFLTWRNQQFFWRCFVSLVKFSYWSKFHVNIITGSRIMTIFFYKGLTRNPEIGNTHVWVLPNSWRMGQVMDTKFGTNISNKILLKAVKFQGYNSYRFWVIKGKLSPPPRLWLKPKHEKAMCQIYEYLKSENRKSIILSGWIAGGITKTITEGRAEVIPTPNSYVWSFLYKTVLVDKCI